MSQCDDNLKKLILNLPETKLFWLGYNKDHFCKVLKRLKGKISNQPNLCNSSLFSFGTITKFTQRFSTERQGQLFGVTLPVSVPTSLSLKQRARPCYILE